MRIVTVVQARLGSVRFPEKILADIEGQPMLRRVLDRAKQITPGAVVLATSSYDSRIARIVGDAAVAWTIGDGFRIPEDDVLGRFAAVAQSHGADVLIRVTGDCPLLCPLMATRLLMHFQRLSLADPMRAPKYASNLGPTTDGFDVEMFTNGVLFRAAQKARDPYDREHVTPFIQRESAESGRGYHMNVAGPSVKLSVDTPDDLEVVRSIYRHVGGDGNFTYKAAIDALRSFAGDEA